MKPHASIAAVLGLAVSLCHGCATPNVGDLADRPLPGAIPAGTDPSRAGSNAQLAGRLPGAPSSSMASAASAAPHVGGAVPSNAPNAIPAGSGSVSVATPFAVAPVPVDAPNAAHPSSSASAVPTAASAAVSNPGAIPPAVSYGPPPTYSSSAQSAPMVSGPISEPSAPPEYSSSNPQRPVLRRIAMSGEGASGFEERAGFGPAGLRPAALGPSSSNGPLRANMADGALRNMAAGPVGFVRDAVSPASLVTESAPPVAPQPSMPPRMDYLQQGPTFSPRTLEPGTIPTATERMLAMQGRLDSLAVSNDELRDRVARVEHNLSDALTRLDASQHEVASLRRDLSDAQEQMRDGYAQFERLADQLEANERAHLQQLDEIISLVRQSVRSEMMRAIASPDDTPPAAPAEPIPSRSAMRTAPSSHSVNPRR